MKAKTKIIAVVTFALALAGWRVCAGAVREYHFETKGYPRFAYEQGYCLEQDVDDENRNSVVVRGSATSANPFGWSKYYWYTIELFVDKTIGFNTIFVKELYLTDGERKVVLVKDKRKKGDRRFIGISIPSLQSKSLSYNDYGLTLVLAYSLDGGELVEERTRVLTTRGF